MSKHTVTISEPNYRWVQEQIAAGLFADEVEVIETLILQRREQALRADIQRGLDDIASGRTSPFDPEDIKRRGKERRARG